jgi:hypothetical protein
MFKVILISLLLSGCSLFSYDSLPEEPIIVHPDLPRPIKIHDIEWNITQTDEDVMVGTSYNDFLNLLDTNYDIGRYIQQLTQSICFYRKDLHEDFCMIQSSNKEK